MRRILGLLGVLTLIVAAAPDRVRAQDPEEYEYTLLDLGAAEAVALNDAGTILLNVDSQGALPRSSVATVDGAGEVSYFPVDGIPGGNGKITGRALGANGTVVGIAHAGEFLADRGTGQPTSPYFRAFRAKGGTVDLGVIEFGDQSGPQTDPDYYASEAFSINASGVIVGQTRSAPLALDQRAVVWPNGSAPPVQLAPSRSSATCVNAAGKIVGWTAVSIVQRAVLWHDQEMFDIDIPSSVQATPADINDRDQVVGSRLFVNPPNPPYQHAFLTQLDGTAVLSNVDLGLLPTGRDSRALAINNDGIVVGSSSIETSPGLFAERAARWKDGAVANLNLLVDPNSPGAPRDAGQALRPWTLTRAVDVNADGDILCRGTVDSGAQQSLRAYLLRARPRGLVVDSQSAVFGDVPAGTTAERSLVVSNASTDALRVRVSKPAKPFTVSGGTNFPLPPGASRTLRIRVTPRAPGELAAEISVAAEGKPPLTVTASANGVPPVRVSPGLVAFGVVRGTATEDVTLTNLTDRRVKVALGSVRSPFALVGQRAAVLGPGEVRTMQVTFTPLAAVESRATLSVVPDIARSAGGTAELTGSGTGTILVSGLTGEVTLRRGLGEAETLSEGDEITADDELTTGVDSGVVLTFPDGGTMTMRELTQIRAATLLYAPDRRDVQIQLKKGEVNAEVTPRKTLQTSFEITTPTATAGVRGTRFDTSYDETAGSTTVRVLEGKVFVAPSNGSLRGVLLRAGRQVHVTATAVSPTEDI